MRKLSICLLAFFCAVTVAQPRTNGQLDRQIKNKLQGFSGQVSLYAVNLDTGASYGLHANRPVKTASTIKLPIMVECYFLVAEGKLKWSEPIKLVNNDIVGGSGILQDLTPGDVLPMRDVVDLMIVMSDNTATNLVLDRIGGDAVNARMAELGLHQTRVMRKVMGAKPQGITKTGAKPKNRKWGLGRTTPREMVTILEKLYRGQLVNSDASEAMIATLKRQRDITGIGRDMQDVTIADKTGALDHLRSGVGIIYSKRGNVAMAITVAHIPKIDWSPDNPGDLMISSLSEILFNGLTAK
ncbi:MAG TPA: serine hydrolase [Bryobacteraceae bacterium]